MPESTHNAESPATTPRRRSESSAADRPGSGRWLAVALAVVAAALGFALYKTKNGADARAETDAKSIGSFSNKVEELRVKLASVQSSQDTVQSNLTAALQRRLGELSTTSNRLVQTSLLLEQAREDARAARTEISTRAGTLALTESQRDDWQRQAASIPDLQREIAGLKDQLQRARFESARLQESVSHLEMEKADLNRRLEDPAFLRVQARNAEDTAELRRRTAAGQRISVSDRRVKLELQPDGTVRAAPGGTEPAKQ